MVKAKRLQISYSLDTEGDSSNSYALENGFTYSVIRDIYKHASSSFNIQSLILFFVMLLKVVLFFFDLMLSET